MKKKIIYLTVCLAVLLCSVSCDKFLNRPPLSSVSPETYFNTVGDLEAYTIQQYSFVTYEGYNLGDILTDNGTDNQAARNPDNDRWAPGQKRVPESSYALDITTIRNLNYFFEQVLPKYERKEIQGDQVLVSHLIGEAYCLRAWEYFKKLKAYGDYPIITEVLPDDSEKLIEASKRRPRNEVARFILSDLDNAISMMSDDTPYGKNRLTRKVAMLLKSRVALFEASWLRYHSGTAFVPGTAEWPGAAKDYNANFSTDLNQEVDFFLTESMEASAEVADAVQLTPSTNVTNPTAGAFDKWNPYFDMFCAVDMEPYEEVLMWRSYLREMDITHGVTSYLSGGGADTGFTKGMIDAFLMQNGLPIYCHGCGYSGDLTIEDVKDGRDLRLQLFVPSPTDVRLFEKSETLLFEAPYIVGGSSVPTGYGVRKFMTYDPDQSYTYGLVNYYGCIVFRAAEAYLNYIEASYMKNGYIDAKADEYWKAIRKRANVNPDYQLTIDNTDLSQEDDWGKWSGEEPVDETLFNIRKERRLELMAEGFRMDDLRRWRSLDKVHNYKIQGFNLWGGELEKLYEGNVGEDQMLIPYGTPGKIANVSSKEMSGTYIAPYQISKNNNLVWDGYNWTTANYLEPLPFREFQLTSPDGNISNSVLYQNPGWPIAANASANGTE